MPLFVAASLSVAQPTTIPKNAPQFLPMVSEEAKAHFPTFENRQFFAGQIEQESCISLTHPKCWNPRSELKTHREYGFGFGQITIAYKADGSERFNNFKAAKTLDRSLADWQWEDRYDPTKQIRTMIMMDKQCYDKAAKWSANSHETTAFMFSCYNGGYSGIITDRKICDNTPGCDPSKWFNNIELYSLKQKTKIKGYGKSMFEINRSYPPTIMFQRSPKYLPYVE